MSRLVLSIAQVAAAAAYLVIGYLYLIAGLAVPGIFLMGLWAVWGALLVVGFTHRDDLRYLIGIPLGTAAVWAAVVLGLGSVLDWQA